MSLLKWKELAKRKTELGNKINYAHNAITQHKIGQDTSQESFKNIFKPITSKLDDVVVSNLNLGMPQRRKRPTKKGEVPDYGIDIDDEVEDMGIGDLFDEQPVLPESEKQLVPKPPTYEESLADILEGNKEIYVDPQYFPGDHQELPPDYYEDEVPDYQINDEDKIKETLDDIGIPDYENVEIKLNQPQMTDKKIKSYLKKIINDAKFKRNQLKWFQGKCHKTIQSRGSCRNLIGKRKIKE